MEQLCAGATSWPEDTEPSPASAACTASARLGMKEESVRLAFSASGIGWEEKGAPLVTLAGDRSEERLVAAGLQCVGRDCVPAGFSCTGCPDQCPPQCKRTARPSSATSPVLQPQGYRAALTSSTELRYASQGQGGADLEADIRIWEGMLLPESVLF